MYLLSLVGVVGVPIYLAMPSLPCCALVVVVVLFCFFLVLLLLWSFFFFSLLLSSSPPPPFSHPRLLTCGPSLVLPFFRFRPRHRDPTAHATQQAQVPRRRSSSLECSSAVPPSPARRPRRPLPTLASLEVAAPQPAVSVLPPSPLGSPARQVFSGTVCLEFATNPETEGLV